MPEGESKEPGRGGGPGGGGVSRGRVCIKGEKQTFRISSSSVEMENKILILKRETKFVPK